MKRQAALSAAIAAGLAGASVGSGWLLPLAAPHADLWRVWLLVAIQLATTPIVFWRLRAPVLTATTIAVSGLVQLLVLTTAPADLAIRHLSLDIWLPVALSMAVAVMTEHHEVPRSAGGPMWVLIGLITLVATRPWEPDWATVLNGLLHSAVPALFGLYLATRRKLIRELRDRADRAEREQSLLAAQARAEERARLASEMHDVVAHRVTLMVLQAGAMVVDATDPADRAALEELRANGSRALDELRDLIGVLRGDSLDTAPTRSTPAPALSTLVDESTRIGLPVELVEDGDPAQLSPVVGRATHRVVQEALTNVRKHAWGSTVRVHARYGDEVTVSVSNSPGTGPLEALADTGSGTGLAGLRERVELVGGTLRAGPGPDGGFLLEATMPARRT